MRTVFLFGLLCLSFLGKASNPIELKAGLIITKHTLIKGGIYYLNAPSNSEEALILIEGNDIEVDFNQAILQGSNEMNQPDGYRGLAIKIAKGAKNIRLKNANIHGYKIAILAEEVEGLEITQCNLSYQWQKKLGSRFDQLEKADRLNFYENENGEWKNQGVAIYLNKVSKARIHHNTVTASQSALLMSNTKDSKIYNNNFQFNSGIGIGLYHASENQIYQNQLDFNIRGFQFGQYQEGLNSAAIMLFEKSGNNTIAYNSATHCGNGIIVSVRKKTGDTGNIGSNDNLLYGNDFSFAANNGIEIRSSRNIIMNNRIQDCEHGIWGNECFELDLTDNQIHNNQIGISLIDGKDINIAMNQFRFNQVGIKIGSSENPPINWNNSTPKNTFSKNYWIAANQFIENTWAYDFRNTDSILLSGNSKIGENNGLSLQEGIENLDSTQESVPFSLSYDKDPRLISIPAKSIPESILPKGKSAIRVTPYGPYNFHYPICWLNKIDSLGNYHFELLGPKGIWELVMVNGFQILEKGQADFPSYLIAKPMESKLPIQLKLVFLGDAFVNQFGKIQAANQAHEFIWKPI